MFLKKLCVYFIVLSFLLSSNLALAADTVLPGVKASIRPATKKEFKNKTAKKRYRPYELTITNNNKKPVLLHAETELRFVLQDDTKETSADRREIYKKSRKRDVGRYWGLGIPGCIIGGGITGITLFIGAPIGAAVAVGMYVPTARAVKSNVDVSQQLYATMDMPIRLEPDKTYKIRVLAPKHTDFKALEITNVGFDAKKMYTIKAPLIEEDWEKAKENL